MLLTEQQITQTESLELLARQVVEGFITGMHKSPFHGFSVEFAEHRLYNTGESTRNIDWKLYARTDKLFVKRYEEETNLRCQLVIDTSTSMYYPSGDPLNKIRFSIYAAASLIHMLKRQRDAAGISLIDEDIMFHSACKSGSVHQKLLFNTLTKLLEKQDKPRKSHLSRNLHLISERLHPRSLVIIFSDMYESAGDLSGLSSALQHLRYNKHEVILFHVNDRSTEVQFDFSNRPYLFTDSETGEQIKLHPEQVKESYLAKTEAFSHELTLRCAQYRIDLVEALTGSDFAQILIPFLIKRGRMY